MSDRAEKLEQARQALLEQIAKNATEGTSTYVLELAEAYAWISYPDNAHGGAKLQK